MAREGAKYSYNAGCEVVGLLKEYLGDACPKEDWTTGGHKTTYGTFASVVHM